MAQKNENAYAEMQAAAQEAQNINSERLRNVALEKQDQLGRAENMQVAAEAGNILASDMGASTAATLGKYGYPKTGPVKGREVKVKPNNITVVNNNITTNNVTGGGKGDDSAAKFKTWVGNAFARQKEESSRREKEYNKREWSLSKSANKMLRKMEGASREVASTFNPRNIGTTVGNQLKMLLMIFGVRFLAKHWTGVLDVLSKVYTGVSNFVAWLGIGEDGQKRRREGTDFQGQLITFLGGNPRSNDKNKNTLIGVLSHIMEMFGDHMKTWFEMQMALRGKAMKEVKFPDLNIGGSSTGIDMVDGMVSGLGQVFKQVFGGVTTYLGDILTALANPEAGISKGIQNQATAQGMERTVQTRSREGAGMFKNHGDTNSGDYSLLERQENGKRKYSLLANAIDSSGNLNGSAGASISQGRDILGAIENAREYGTLDVNRMTTGLTRLYNQSKSSKDGVIVDEEFITSMFGGNKQKYISEGKIKPVRMKFVREKMTDEDKYLESKYAVDKHGGGTLMSGLMNFGATADLLSMGLFGTGNASTSDNLKRVGKDVLDMTLGPGINAVRGYVQASNREDEALGYKYSLVPENDPRPEAAIDGRKLGAQVYYALEEDALKALAGELSGGKANNFDASNYSYIMPGVEQRLTTLGGGQAAMARRYNSGGVKAGFTSQLDGDYHQSLAKLQEFQDTKAAWETKLNNDEFSQWKAEVKHNAIDLYNTVATGANDLIERGYSWARSFTDAKNATFAYDMEPTSPVNTTFDVNAACDTLRRNSKAKPTSWCARHVRWALTAGLGEDVSQMISKLGGDKHAHSYSGYMGSLGFAPLDWNGYYPKKGDVLVEPANYKHPVGHIAMFDGNQWISDFRQRDMWGGGTFRNIKQGVVFRHTSLLSNSDTQGLGLSNGTVAENTTGISSAYSLAGSGKTTVVKSRGEWFNQHKSRWKNYLLSTGMEEGRADKISSFYAAQDGVESDAGKSDAAKYKNNWGGMQSNRKNITYGSFEEYAAAKHKMMTDRFGYALDASNLTEYVTALGDPSKKQLYYQAEGYDHVTKRGIGLQYDEVSRYVGRANNFLVSGASMQFEGADMDEDLVPNLPTLDNPTPSTREMQIQNELSSLYIEKKNMMTGFSSFRNFQDWYLSKPAYKQKRINTILKHLSPAVYNNIKSLFPDRTMAGVLNTLINSNGDTWLNVLNGWIKGTTYDRAVKDSSNLYRKDRYIDRLSKFDEITGLDDIAEDVLSTLKDENGNVYQYKRNSVASAHDNVTKLGKRDVGNFKAYELIHQEILKGNKDIVGKGSDGKYLNKNYNDMLGASVIFGKEFISMAEKIKELTEKMDEEGSLSGNEAAELRRLKTNKALYEEVSGKYVERAGDMTESERKIAFGATKDYVKLKEQLYDLDEKKSDLTLEMNRRSDYYKNTLSGDSLNKALADLKKEYSDQFKAINDQRAVVSNGLKDFTEYMDEQTKKLYSQSMSDSITASTDQMVARFKELTDKSRKGGPLSMIDAFNTLSKEFGDGFIEAVNAKLDHGTALVGKGEKVFAEYLSKDPDFSYLETTLSKADDLASLENAFQEIRGAWNLARGIEEQRSIWGVKKDVNKTKISTALNHAKSLWDDHQQFNGLGRPFGTSKTGRKLRFKNENDGKTYIADLEKYWRGGGGGYKPVGFEDVGNGTGGIGSTNAERTYNKNTIDLDRVSKRSTNNVDSNRYNTGPYATESGMPVDAAVYARKKKTGNKDDGGYAEGGYTEPGAKWDEAGILGSGEKVHAGEWVAPAWMVRDPAYRPLIGLLEKSRVTKKAGIDVASSEKVDNSDVLDKLEHLIQIASQGNEYAALGVKATSEGLSHVGSIIANKPTSSPVQTSGARPVRSYTK